MHILILGAGALGSFLGGRLSKATEVTLYSTNKAHMQAVQTHGLLIEEMDGQWTRSDIRACFHPSQFTSTPDIVIVLVKAYATFEAVSSVLGYFQSTPYLITLQNGIGNWESIAELVPESHILAGITSLGSTFVAPGHIKHGGHGPTIIGKINPDFPDQRLDSLVQLFLESELPAEKTPCPQIHIWNKLLINLGINAITALLDLPNGWIVDNQQAKDVAIQAVEEGLKVAKAYGITVDKEIIQKVLQVAKDTSKNISSMNQDLRRKKQTEIEAINGAIVRLGKDLNIATPVNSTLSNLIKVAETKNLQGGQI